MPFGTLLPHNDFRFLSPDLTLQRVAIPQLFAYRATVRYCVSPYSRIL
jgi:hypothetical protein